jgi:speckle-type POZ protein
LGTTRAPAVESFLGGDQLFRNQLETFYEKMMLSDVYFDVGDREFKAHKSILALRSPVFAAMFEHPTKEKLTNRVVIEDIEPDVFQELLRFIYTGRLSLSTMNVMATEILSAANKYLLDQLKIECENHLIYCMSADNCLEILLLQDKNHPSYYLRKEAAKFFRSRPDKVMATDRWKEVKEKNSILLCDIQEFVFRSDLKQENVS